MILPSIAPFSNSQTGPPGSGGGGGSSKRFTIVEIQGDYTIGNEIGEDLDPGEEPTPVIIAKPEEVRTSVANEIVDGVLYTFAYAGSNQRTSTKAGGSVQIEVCYKRYRVGQVITAIQMANETGVPDADWLEIKPTRLWARKYQQV